MFLVVLQQNQSLAAERSCTLWRPCTPILGNSVIMRAFSQVALTLPPVPILLVFVLVLQVLDLPLALVDRLFHSCFLVERADNLLGIQESANML